MTKTLSTIKKEFEEKFNSGDNALRMSTYGQGYNKDRPVADDILKWLESTIHSLMKKVVPEEKDLGKTDEDSTLKYYSGFNKACTEMKENISKLMK